MGHADRVAAGMRSGPWKMGEQSMATQVTHAGHVQKRKCTMGAIDWNEVIPLVTS